MFPLFAGLAKNQPALHGSLFEPSHLRILAELGMFADVPLGSTHATVLKVIDLVSRSEVDRTVHALVSRTRVLRAALGVSGILKLSALLAIAVNMAPAREPPRDSAPAPAQ